MPETSTWLELYTILKVNLTLSRIFGSTTLSFSKKDIKPSKIKPIFNVLCIIVYVPLCINEIVYILRHYKSFVIFITDIISYVISMIFLLTLWINAICNQDKFLRLLQDMIKFDTKMKSGGHTINYSLHHKYNKQQLIVRIIMASTSSIGQLCSPPSHYTIYGYIIDYLPLFVSASVNVLTFSLLFFVKYRVQTINTRLTDTIRNVQKHKEFNAAIKENQVLALQETRMLYHEMTKITQQINDSLGFVLLAWFGDSFFNIVCGFYYIFYALRSTSFRTNLFINSIFLSVYYVVETILLCKAFQDTLDELKDVGVRLYEIDTKDDYIKNEIELFSLQIANERVEFNAGGFFPVNLNFLFTVSLFKLLYFIINLYIFR